MKPSHSVLATSPNIELSLTAASLSSASVSSRSGGLFFFFTAQSISGKLHSNWSIFFVMGKC